MKFLLISITLIVLTACIDTSVKSPKGTNTIGNSSRTHESFAEFSNGIDSLELIFYPDPQNKRIFSSIIVHDTLFINSLKNNLKQSSFAAAECDHLFKLYLFGNGNVYKTIYLSDSCNYLAFAQNDKQVFIMLEKEIKQNLDSIKISMDQRLK